MSYDITKTTDYLRLTAISPWIQDTRRLYKNKCILSGKKRNIEIHHHIVTFKHLVKETFNTLHIKFNPKTSTYTQEELKLISDQLLRLHYKYGLGVTLTKSIHKKLHIQTGGGYGKPYEDFVKQYKLYKQKVYM